MDILEILMGEDEESAQQKAQMMADAVRRKQAVGSLGLLTGDRVLSRFGQGQMQAAGDESADLSSSLKVRAGGALQKALAKQRQDFEVAEGAKDRGSRERMQRAALGAREGAATEKAGHQGSKDAAARRKEYEGMPGIKAFRDIGVAYEKLEQAAAKPSAAGDLSLIFSYMKMLDPGSTVREGEFANAQNAAGVDGRIVAAYNKVASGQRLSPEQRADFLNQAGIYYGAHEKQATGLANRYREIATEEGLNPDLVALPIQPRGAKAAPSKGTPSNGNVSLEAAPGKVKVSNGAETYEIDADKVAEAEAEGYERVP